MNRGDLSRQSLVLLSAWSLSFLAPSAYLLISYQSQCSVLLSQSELCADVVSQVVASHPDDWQTRSELLVKTLERCSRDRVPEFRRIVDTGGRVIAKNRVILPSPVATYVDLVRGREGVVARVEVSRSLRPLLQRVLVIALVSALIAVGLFFLLRALPKRILALARQALGESERKYRQLFENMREGMALHRVDRDAGGEFSLRVIDMNPSCASMFDGDHTALIGSNSCALFGETFREFLSELLRLMKHGDSIEFELKLPNTERLYNVQAFSPGQGLIATLFEDITERRKSEQQIQQMAYFDPLTGLPNRVLFFDRLKQAIARSVREREGLAVLFLDLDRFKDINDTLGHSAGDQLLVEVTRRLGRHIRSSDTLARLGGDEFVVVVTSLEDSLNATCVARSLIEAIQPPFQITGHELHVTTSIGIALFPDDGHDAETLIKHADLAMYASKESGRNKYKFFSTSMNQKALKRMEIEAGMRVALERGEFFVEFQPIVSAADGSITAAETLVRWAHPTRGTVSPTEFIELAEETGLIIPLGEWVLRTVCGKMKLWSDAGLPLIRYTVNVSSRQIEQKGFAEMVRNVLRESGANGAQLEIELTESCLIQHSDSNIPDVFGLKDWGVSIAIDDFGTGYSSLGYIKTLPIDHIKIDRSFVRDINTNFHDQAIVQAIIAMSRSLGLQTIAEGVETEEQVSFLRRYGCSELQGYYFHQPLSAEVLEGLLREQER